MGTQVTWHSDYFYFRKQGYSDDYRDQQVSKDKKGTSEYAKAQNAYKTSQSLYKSAKLDSDLLSKVINDPGSNAFTDETKRLILQSKLYCLKPLMVNANSATRKSELKGYEDEVREYQKKLDTIESRIRKNKSVSATEKDVNKKWEELGANTDLLNELNNTQAQKVETWFEQTLNFFKSFFLLSPLAFVRWVGELNLYRLSYRFSQISWKNIWTYLKSLGILDSGSKLHGLFINISMMDYPVTIFNALSVLIFALKLSISLTLPVKHALAPTSQAELAFRWWERAWIEIARVWDIYANDIFWMIFNGITNFPLWVGLSIPVANWILTGALFFDVAVLSVLLYKEEKKLNEEIAWLNTQISLAKENKDNAYVEMYTAMQHQAQITKISNRATLTACIIATAMFITSMALILSLATPLMAPIGFFVCVLAVAIILARKDIGQYAEAKASQHIFKNEYATKDIRAANAREKGWQLAKSLAEFVFIPMLIIGLYTISLPAAIAFTVIYVSVKASGVKLTSVTSDDTTKRIEFEDDASTISPLHA